MDRAQAEVVAKGLISSAKSRENRLPLEPRLVPYTIGITGNTDAWLVRLIGYALALLSILASLRWLH
jgi:hypothetical protein